jgi:glutamine amidotransferase-like uncharacterized protein
MAARLETGAQKLLTRPRAEASAASWLLYLSVVALSLAGCISAPPEVAGDELAVDTTDELVQHQDALPDNVQDSHPHDADTEPEVSTDATRVDTSTDLSTELADDDLVPVARVVGIYDDTASPSPGAWGEGLDLLEVALSDAGLLSERVTREQLNEPGFDLGRYRALVFGGGYAYPGYTLLITESAKARLRRYVEQGGVFMGVCAGAYFACNTIRWEGATYGDESGYTLDLFGGTCVGPIDELAAFPEWALSAISFPEHPAWQSFEAAPFERTLWYGGGPTFVAKVGMGEVLARYAGDDLSVAGEAALLVIEREAGAVILWGPHPEVRDSGASADAWQLAGHLLQWTLSTR